MGALKDIAQGKPLRSPLHPALVHLPVALFPLALLLDVGSWVWRGADAGLVRAAFFSHVLGLATGLVAALFGLVDYTEIRKDHPARKTATRHLVLNVVAIALFAVSTWIRWGDPERAPTPLLPLVITLVGVAVLSYSGYLGGRLVYDDGIAVGRHRRPDRLPAETLVVSGKGGAVCVAEDGALKDGETMRAEVNGIVVTIARIGGAWYAFQEFCSHRYGPLSEGALKGCEVVCPWHGSRFDVRTGKVTGGPAKVDLRTFRVESREGKIWIEP
jgi:uncharacterized membrane protein/nitrite reductase/ring-hydroxylating ferredoxin subunit